MATIINDLNVVEYNDNQVHVENNEKLLISSLPVNIYQMKNNLGSMVEIKVHECIDCGKKFILKDELKKLKKHVRNIKVLHLSNEDFFASTFDVIINKSNERIISSDQTKKKSRKEKREAKRQKRKYGTIIAGKTRLVSPATKLNILPEEYESEKFTKLYLLFSVGKLFIQKEALCEVETNKNYISEEIFEFIKNNGISCLVYKKDERIYPKKDITKVNTNIIKQNINHINNKVSKSTNKISFLVRSQLKSCVSKRHNLNSIIVEIQVIDINGTIKNIEVNGFYCNDCKLYYILDSEYERIRRKGTPLCQIFEEIKYLNNNSNKFDLNYESILYSFGYNVNSQNNLSDKQRLKILTFIIDNGILSKSEVISYLNYFINMRIGRKEYQNAINKWKNDIKLLNSYKSIKIDKKVDTIKVIKYIHK